MEDLTIEEIKQLVTFYRQRATDTEFTLLQTQLKLNRFLLTEPAVEKTTLIKKITRVIILNEFFIIIEMLMIV